MHGEFESQAALEAYATHPKHVRVKRELGDLSVARHQVDDATPVEEKEAVMADDIRNHAGPLPVV